MTDASERDRIEAIRTDLAAWSAGKPKAVRNAVANLDRWLDEAAIADPDIDYRVNVLACTARAVETLRCATRACPSGR